MMLLCGVPFEFCTAPGRERNEVRTFWENIVDEIEIPIYAIYDIPVQCK